VLRFRVPPRGPRTLFSQGQRIGAPARFLQQRDFQPDQILNAGVAEQRGACDGQSLLRVALVDFQLRKSDLRRPRFRKQTCLRICPRRPKERLRFSTSSLDEQIAPQGDSGRGEARPLRYNRAKGLLRFRIFRKGSVLVFYTEIDNDLANDLRKP